MFYAITRLFIISLLFTSLLAFSNEKNKIEEKTTYNKEQDKDSLIVDGYIQLSRENEHNSAFKSYLYLDSALSYSKINNYTIGIYKSRYEKAIVYYLKGRIDDAITELESIRDIIHQTPLEKQSFYYTMFGISYLEKDLLDSSLKYLNKALVINKQINSPSGIVGSLANLGMCLDKLGLKKEALEKFKEGVDYCIKFKNDKDIIKNNHLNIIRLNYATSLFKSGQTTKGEKLFIELLEDEENNKNPYFKESLISSWASVQSELGNYNEALKFYNEAIEYSIDNEIFNTINNNTGLAGVHLKMKHPKLAIAEYRKAEKLNPVYYDYTFIYHGLAESFALLQMQDSSIYYWEKLIELIEDKYEADSKIKLDGIYKNLEEYKSKIEIDLLEKDNKILEQSNENRFYVILFLVLLLLFVSGFVYLLKKNQKEKKKTFLKEIELKNQSLITYALKISQKNKLLIELNEKIDEDYEDAEKAIDEIKNDLIKAISNSTKNDKNWKQYDKYFNDVHKGFYDNLKIKYSDLTVNDMRICSLIKLSLSIKEISEILFLSDETIKSNRYRIRTKMGLKRDQDLLECLNMV